MYKQMASSFWEKWQWEADQRKEVARVGSVGTHVQSNVKLQEINLDMHADPVSAATDMELYTWGGKPLEL